eukprot:5260512-Karenia_brevis.AAC.1
MSPLPLPSTLLAKTSTFLTCILLLQQHCLHQLGSQVVSIKLEAQTTTKVVERAAKVNPKRRATIVHPTKGSQIMGWIHND